MRLERLPAPLEAVCALYGKSSVADLEPQPTAHAVTLFPAEDKDFHPFPEPQRKPKFYGLDKPGHGQSLGCAGPGAGLGRQEGQTGDARLLTRKAAASGLPTCEMGPLSSAGATACRDSGHCLPGVCRDRGIVHWGLQVLWVVSHAF